MRLCPKEQASVPMSVFVSVSCVSVQPVPVASMFVRVVREMDNVPP